MGRGAEGASGGAGDAAFALCLLPLSFAALALARLAPAFAYGGPLLAWLAVAAPAWWFAVALARRGAGDLRLVVAGAIALRLLGLAGAPELSDDAFRYAWEGRVVLHGASPYAYAPDAPELAGLRAELPELHAGVNHPEVSAIYPPLAQLAAAAIAGLARLAGDVDGSGALALLRLFYTLCDLLVLLPLAMLLRRRRLPVGLSVAWGWCPLVTLEYAGSGHLDSLAILLLVSALACFEPLLRAARRPWPAGRELAGLALLAGAALVKLLPLAALPFVARGRGAWRRACVALLLVAVAFVPLGFLDGGWRGLLTGAWNYGLRWESTPLVYRFLEWPFALLAGEPAAFDPRKLGRSLALFLWLAAGALAWRRRWSCVRATEALVGAWLVLSPTFHPWYATWILPFVALRPRASWLWLTGAAPVLYAPLVRYRTEGVWRESGEWLVVAPLFLALLAREVFVEGAASRARGGDRSERLLA